MPYVPKDWADGPGGGTPILATDLEHLETQYAQAVTDAAAGVVDVVRVDDTGALIGPDGQPIAAPVVLVLDAGESVPPGTPSGTLIARLPGDVVVFSDAFDRADGAVGNGWTITQGFVLSAGEMVIVGSVTGTSLAFAPNATATSRDFVQADVDGFGGSDVEPFLILAGSARTTSFSGYVARYNAATANYQIYRVVSGTLTLVATGTGTLPATGAHYTARLEREGADINYLVNGIAKVAYTDPSPLAGHFCGVRSVAVPTGRKVYVDNFSFGDLAT